MYVPRVKRTTEREDREKERCCEGKLLSSVFFGMIEGEREDREGKGVGVTERVNRGRWHVREF